MEYKVCSIKGFEGLYHIYDNGDIYSIRKRRMLKPTLNGNPPYSYLYVCLVGNNREFWRGPSHIITAIHWIGPKPSEKHEINHKDLDKLNNWYTNLEWVTHQQNMIHARQEKSWVPGRYGYTFSEESKRKMGEKKFKKVLFFNDTEDLVYTSIKEALEKHGIYRKAFNRYVGTNKMYKGYKMKFL
jgi:hypothetical protein